MLHSSRVRVRVAAASRGATSALAPAARVLMPIATALLVAGTFSPAASGAEAHASGCDKVAAVGGSDHANGTEQAPFATVQRLVEALAPGEVGCLRGGTYSGGLTVMHGGTASAPVVVRSYPEERATIDGRVYVPRESNYVTIADLGLDGNYQSTASPLPSPTVNAAHITFEGDDVTNEHTGICFDLGSKEWGVAEDTVITDSRIHDCGALPATNYEHGIYVADAIGTQITDDTIVRNADRGIQLYPNSRGARIEDDIIAENGENIIFSGAEGIASSDNTVEHNLIVDAQIRYDVESWYPAGTPEGTGNVVRHNCISQGGVLTDSGGFTVEANVAAAGDELTTSSAGTATAIAGSSCAAQVPSLAATSSPEASSPEGTVPGGGQTAGKEGEESTTGAQPESPVGHGSSTSTEGGAGSSTGDSAPAGTQSAGGGAASGGGQTAARGKREHSKGSAGVRKNAVRARVARQGRRTGLSWRRGRAHRGSLSSRHHGGRRKP